MSFAWTMLTYWRDKELDGALDRVYQDLAGVEKNKAATERTLAALRALGLTAYPEAAFCGYGMVLKEAVSRRSYFGAGRCLMLALLQIKAMVFGPPHIGLKRVMSELHEVLGPDGADKKEAIAREVAAALQRVGEGWAGVGDWKGDARWWDYLSA